MILKNALEKASSIKYLVRVIINAYIYIYIIVISELMPLPVWLKVFECSKIMHEDGLSMGCNGQEKPLNFRRIPSSRQHVQWYCTSRAHKKQVRKYSRNVHFVPFVPRWWRSHIHIRQPRLCYPVPSCFASIEGRPHDMIKNSISPCRKPKIIFYRPSKK